MFSDEPEYDLGCFWGRVFVGKVLERFSVGVADEEGKCVSYGSHFLTVLKEWVAVFWLPSLTYYY